MAKKCRIKKGDLVQIMTGKDKGRRGKVVAVDLKKDRVVVEGLNQMKKHTKTTQQKPGGIVTREAPLHVSNVMLVDPDLSKPTRVGRRAEGTRRERFAKKSGKSID